MSNSNKVMIIVAAAAVLAVGMNAQARRSSSRLSPADEKEIYNYVLTVDKVQKTSAATNGLTQLTRNHPGLNNVGQSKTIDGMLQNIQRYPEAVAVINRSGLSPREYVDCLVTVLQSAIAVSLKKSGAFKEYPPELLQTVSKANLQFTEQHWNEIQKIAAAGDDDQ